MNKLPLAAAAALFALSATAASAETRILDVEAFHAVEVASGVSADITAGASQSVVADAPSSKDFDDFRYEVRDGVLHVWYDWNIFHIFDFSVHQVKVTVSVPSFDGLTVTSGASALASGISGENARLEVTSGASASVRNSAGRAYDIAVTSGAHLDIDGSCDSAKLEVTSGASLSAQALTCVDVTASVTTGASATITAIGTIGGEATTGASLTAYGSPEVRDLETTTGASTNFPR
jgi:hypothetical protein